MEIESSESTTVESTDASTAPAESSEISASASEGGEELQDQIDQALEDGATPEQIEELIEEFELKVNGKTIKATLNLKDKEAIKKELQKAYAFNEASQEAAKYKKDLEKLNGAFKDTTGKFETVLQEWKKTPSKFFEALGMDKYEFINQQIEEHLAEIEMDPKEKELRSERQKREELENRFKKIEEERQAKEEAERKKAEQEAYENEIASIEASINQGLSSSTIVKSLIDSNIVDAETMFYEAVDLMTRLQQSVGEESRLIEVEDVLPLLEKKYKTVYDLYSKTVKKPSAPAKPAPKKTVPVGPQDVKSTATSAVETTKARQEAQKNAPKPSFSSVWKSRD